MINFARNGYQLDYNNSSGSTIPSSSVVVLNPGNAGGIGVAEDDIQTATVGSVRVAGVVRLPSNATDTANQLSKVYWDATNQVVTVTATNNTYAGLIAWPKLNGDTTAGVMLNGMPGGGGIDG